MFSILLILFTLSLKSFQLHLPLPFLQNCIIQLNFLKNGNYYYYINIFLNRPNPPSLILLPIPPKFTPEEISGNDKQPKRGPFDDIVKFPYHQPKYSLCFAKIYFLTEKENSWRNIFYNERSLTNLNRVPDFVLVFSVSGQLPKSEVEFPWTFLEAAIHRMPALQFMTPANFFLVTDEKLYSICIICRDKTRLFRKVPGALMHLNILSNPNKFLRNLQGNIFVTMHIPQGSCSFSNFVERTDASGYSCALKEFSKVVNYTLVHMLRLAAELYDKSKPRRTAISLTLEVPYDHETQRKFSYAAQRRNLARFDAIAVHSRIDYFTFSVLDLSSGQPTVQVSIRALWETLHWKIWGSVFGSAILVFLTLYIITWNRSKSSFSIGFFLFATTMDQSQPNFARQRKQRNLDGLRIMVSVWLLIAFGTTNTYRSVMLSVWVQPPSIKIPADVKELVESGLRILTTELETLEKVSEHMQVISEELGIETPPILLRLIEKLESIEDYVSSPLELLNGLPSALIPRNNQSDNSDKFAIFETADRLKRLRHYALKHFPQMCVSVSPTYEQELIRNYQWTSSRTLAYPVLQMGGMSLYESGFYIKWQEYYDAFRDKVDQHNIEIEREENEKRIEEKEGIGITAFEGFLSLYTISVGILVIIFCLEFIVFKIRSIDRERVLKKARKFNIVQIIVYSAK